MIIYFTGTGNSRYIAQLFAKALGDQTVNAAELIKSGTYPGFDSEKPYIFISPVYAWRLPRVFEQWLKQCTFQGSRKAYFVLTCGDSIGAAGNYVQTLSSKLGFEHMGTAKIVMPENYIAMFSAPSREEAEKILSAAVAQADGLCRQVAAEMPFEKGKISFAGHLCSHIVTPFFYTFSVGAKKFYATDACISCGKCVENCMLNNIQLKDGKPVWGRDCTHCMACICKCPTEAIEYGKHTQGLRRYVCPEKH